jgi:tRNA pseudouridine65 synthase
MTEIEKKSPIEVLYRDEFIAVVNKPAGLMAHSSPLARGEDDFLHDRLREQFGCKIFLIHRLDRATSGCLLIAFDNASASILGKQFMTREVEKNYLAICRGWPEEVFTVDHDLDGGPGKPEKKPAITEFKRLATAELDLVSAHHESSRYALMQCTPYTGRFRQIRRHLKHSFHHLIGDTSHGDGRHNRHFRMMGVHRMLLHAWRLSFQHPISHEAMTLEAGWDAEFEKAIQKLGWAEIQY